MLSGIHSPASLLASCFNEPTSRQPELLLLSGARGAGKTRWCLELAREAGKLTERAPGFQAAGLVSPALFGNGKKTGIDLLDLASGESRRLASRIDPANPSHGLSTEDWRFNEETLAWGDACLRKIQCCDLFILDEAGPLEFFRGLGWQAGMEFVGSRRYRLACVVVRPGLLQAAQELWPWAEVLELLP